MIPMRFADSFGDANQSAFMSRDRCSHDNLIVGDGDQNDHEYLRLNRLTHCEKKHRLKELRI